jgi:uncharacterized protein (TIGR03067 family)
MIHHLPLSALESGRQGALNLDIADVDEAAQAEYRKLQGSWLLVYWLYDGTDPHQSKDPIVLSFEAERFTIRIGDTVTEEGAFVGPDPRQHPKSIVYAPSRLHGQPVDLKYPGIYLLEDDLLVFCIGYARERPRGFSAEAGSHNELVIYKRLRAGA